jgi:uracil-DNA glycosylase
MFSLVSSIPVDWKEKLSNNGSLESLDKVQSFLDQKMNEGVEIFPPLDQVFSAFDMCNFDNTKVVILGQDPYHGKGEAHGLSFSVKTGVKIPPSLKNIFTELNSDIVDFISPSSGDLSTWAQQGVLLLNAYLTVTKDNPGSHQKSGWNVFTDEIIKLLSSQKEHLVFILWGKFAQAKRALIDDQKHLIIESPHPSPFSVHKGFYGSKPFSKANDFLKSKSIKEVDWTLSNIQTTLDL